MKKLLTFLLVLAFFVSVLPVRVFAEDVAQPEQPQQQTVVEETETVQPQENAVPEVTEVTEQLPADEQKNEATNEIPAVEQLESEVPQNEQPVVPQAPAEEADEEVKADAETRDITVTIEWTEDEEWKDLCRPDNVTLQLQVKSGNRYVNYGEPVTIASTETSYVFTDCPVLDEKGRTVIYAVYESFDIANDSYSGDGRSVEEKNGTVAITNKMLKNSKGKIVLTWIDEHDADQIRPTKVELNKLINGEVYGEPVLIDSTDTSLVTKSTTSEGDLWTYKGRVYYPGYDKEGNSLTLTFAKSDDPDDHFGYANPPAHPTDGATQLWYYHKVGRMVVELTTVWEDDNDRDGHRRTVYQYLSASVNGTTYGEKHNSTVYVTSADENNEYYGTINSVIKYHGGTPVEYTIREYSQMVDITDPNAPQTTPGESGGKIELDGVNYTVEYSRKTFTTNGITGEETVELTVTNTFEPETVDVNVSKVWSDNDDQDGFRPESVNVTLYVDNEKSETKALTAADEWKVSWTDLYKYQNHGQEIKYSVDEELDDVVTGVNGPGTYEKKVEGDVEKGFVITNTHTPEKIDVTVTKKWEDNDNNDGFRPDDVTVELTANDESVERAVLAEEGQWTHTFTGLDKYAGGKEIVYDVKEVEVDKYTAEYSGNYKEGIVITNTHEDETINVAVRKVWEDDNDVDKLRPAQVTVTLYVNGEPTEYSLVLTAADNWYGEFENVKKYKNGEEVEYTLVEQDVKGYDKLVQGDFRNGFMVTNTHIPVPNTGDERNLLLYGLLMAVGALGSSITFAQMKKEDEE